MAAMIGCSLAASTANASSLAFDAICSKLAVGASSLIDGLLFERPRGATCVVTNMRVPGEHYEAESGTGDARGFVR